MSQAEKNTDSIKQIIALAVVVGLMLGIVSVYALYRAQVEGATMVIVGAAIIAVVVAVMAMFKTTGRLIRQLAKSEKEKSAHLTRVEDQRRALDVHAIVSITDGNGVIIYANDHFCELSEYSRNEIVGSTHGIVNSGCHAKEFFTEIWAAIREGVPWRGEIKNRTKSGGDYWVDTSIVPFHDKDGEIDQFIAVQTDITKRKQNEEELKLAREKAVAASDAKSMFLANMSHEIRTPMNAILGFSELLVDSTDMGGEQAEYVEAIQRSGSLLLDLINDVLDISRIESGNVRVYRESVNIPRLVRQICDALSVQSDSKGITLDCEFQGDARCNVKTDGEKLTQLLAKLIGNAVKFTELGGVSVNVSMENRNWSDDWLCVEIADTGKGISDAFMSDVFEKFVQEDVSHTRKQGGAGLGLAISRGLAHVLGGDIHVSSKSEKGSVFTVEIPVERENQLLELREIKAQHSQRSHYLAKALVVEDNVNNQFLALTMLNGFGIECDLASDGSDAIDCLSRNSYDIVFMDYQMPVMDGFEATKAIREAEAFKDAPRQLIVAMMGDREECIAVGMDDYLSKPFTVEALGLILSKYLQSKKVESISADA